MGLNGWERVGVAWWAEWIQKSDQGVQSVLLGNMTTKELLTSWDEYWTAKYKKG